METSDMFIYGGIGLIAYQLLGNQIPTPPPIPTTGQIRIKVLLDGQAVDATGIVLHMESPGLITNPTARDIVAAGNVYQKPIGSNKLIFDGGTPAGTVFVNITPSDTQNVTADKETVWTLNFKSISPTPIYIAPLPTKPNPLLSEINWIDTDNLISNPGDIYQVARESGGDPILKAVYNWIFHIPVNEIMWKDKNATIPITNNPKIYYPNYGRYAIFLKFTFPQNTKWLSVMIGGSLALGPIATPMIVMNQDPMTYENAWNIYFGNTHMNSDGSAGPGYNTLHYGLCREGVMQNGACKTLDNGSRMIIDITSFHRSIVAIPFNTAGGRVWHRHSQDYESQGSPIRLLDSHDEQGRHFEAIPERTIYIMIVCEDSKSNVRDFKYGVGRLEIAAYS